MAACSHNRCGDFLQIDAALSKDFELEVACLLIEKQ